MPSQLFSELVFFHFSPHHLSFIKEVRSRIKGNSVGDLSSCQPPPHTLPTWGGRRSEIFWEGAQRWHLIRSWLAGPWGKDRVCVWGLLLVGVWTLRSGPLFLEWPSLAFPFRLPPTTWAACTLFSEQEWQRQRPGAKFASFLPLGKNIHPRETPIHLFRNLPTLTLFSELFTMT